MFENLSIEQLVQLPVLATLVWYFALITNRKIDVLQKAVEELRVEFTELKTRVLGNGLYKQFEELREEFKECKEKHSVKRLS